MRKQIIGILLAIVALLGGYQVSQRVGGNYNHLITVLNGVSATTTSQAIDIEGAERVTLSLKVASLAESGKATSTFTFSASTDGTNFVTYNKLVDNVANTISQNVTRVASKAIDSNTTAVLSFDLSNDTFKYFKVIDTITGTTTSVVTVKALIDY